MRGKEGGGHYVLHQLLCLMTETEPEVKQNKKRKLSSQI